MQLIVKSNMLDDAVERLREAAATFDLGRSFPEVSTLTDAGDTVQKYFDAIRIACEVLTQTAQHTAESAVDIHTSFIEADTALSRHATEPRQALE